MYCKKCGYLIKEGSLFCENCGEKIVEGNLTILQNNQQTLYTPQNNEISNNQQALYTPQNNEISNNQQTLYTPQNNEISNNQQTLYTPQNNEISNNQQTQYNQMKNFKPSLPKKRSNTLFIIIVIVLILAIGGIITAIIINKTDKTLSNVGNDPVVETDNSKNPVSNDNVVTIYDVKFTIPNTLRFELYEENRFILTEKTGKYQFDFTYTNIIYDSVKMDSTAFEKELNNLGYTVILHGIKTFGTREYMIYDLKYTDGETYSLYLTKLDSKNSYYGYISILENSNYITTLFNNINAIINSASGSFVAGDTGKNANKFNDTSHIDNTEKSDFSLAN